MSDAPALLLTPAQEFLSAQELRTLTDKARPDGQARVLADIGIPFRQIGRRLIVSRHHAREWLAGRTIAPSSEPNSAAIL